MNPLEASHRKLLLDLARESITHSLKTGETLHPNPQEFPPPLQEYQATFVTLHVAGDLKGCVGVLKPIRPLVMDVAANACAAAFQDSRFSPIKKEDMGDLTIHISLLSPLEEMSFISEQDLLGKMRPGIDGIVLCEGDCHATFLPVVWELLPEPRDFLNELKQKAGLSRNYWSDSIRVERYTVESIQDFILV